MTVLAQPHPPQKTPKLTDADVKAMMAFRASDSCATCKHCTKHPDSGRGGESYTLYQCVANAVHHFKLPAQETSEYICNHFCAEDSVRGKVG